jgi:hypothetical protein
MHSRFDRFTKNGNNACRSVPTQQHRCFVCYRAPGSANQQGLMIYGLKCSSALPHTNRETKAMTSLNLSVTEKNHIQALVEYIQTNPRELDQFTKGVAGGTEAAWRRFLKGTYNHPITWWVGIFQLQMQVGVWGHHHRSVASTRASVLWQLTQPLRNEAAGLVSGRDAPMLYAIVRYYLKHRKADIVGRLAGGAFTNYASTGGRLGNKSLSKAGTKGTAIKVTVAFYQFWYRQLRRSH